MHTANGDGSKTATVLLRTQSFVSFPVYETRRICLSPFNSKVKVLGHISSFFLSVQLSRCYRPY